MVAGEDVQRLTIAGGDTETRRVLSEPLLNHSKIGLGEILHDVDGHLPK
jgi:hypothetical protein